jgi:peptidoglycan-associated lipoprotein
MKRNGKLAFGAISVVLLALAIGCTKKVPVAAAPAPPQAAVPEAPTAPPPVAVAAAEPSPVTPPPFVPAPIVPPALTFTERLAREVHDAYFDFDRSDLRPDAREALTANARALELIFQDFPNMNVVIQGHCDERGSAEYNVALGDRRATVTKDFISAIGIPQDRFVAISYGKERPQCTEPDEACWQKNRRVHFVAGELQRQVSQAAEPGGEEGSR